MPQLIEKDFWICWMLKILFEDPPSFESILKKLKGIEDKINRI